MGGGGREACASCGGCGVLRTLAAMPFTFVHVAHAGLLEERVDLEQLRLVGDRVLDDLGGGRVEVLLFGG